MSVYNKDPTSLLTLFLILYLMNNNSYKLQVWMTSSLLSDGMAIAGQAIIACAFAEKDYEKAKVMAFGSEARCSCWTPFAIWIWNIYKGQKCCSPH
ncbi:hypothetical protein CsSME_00006486 [Camellia sinensis var. sinensis]